MAKTDAKRPHIFCGGCLMTAVMSAVAIYFVVLGIRVQFMCYAWLCWDSILLYIVGIIFFMWGKSMILRQRR